MKILALSTFPIRRARHGGQRRINAFADLYKKLGAKFEVAAVYDAAYSSDDIGPNDIAIGHGDPYWAGVPFTGDMQAGEFAANSPAAYGHFCRVLERTKPDIISLEHPFMWPLVRRFRAEGRIENCKIIYSSHNWEGPLKEGILLAASIKRSQAREIGARVEALEKELADAADLILTVSERDAQTYRGLGLAAPVLIAPNGVERTPTGTLRLPLAAKEFQGRRFLFYVGSAYPPNIDGFTKLVAEGGLFFTPPLKSFAVCGGVCDGIFRSHPYHRFVSANSERVQFFPNPDDLQLAALKNAAHGVILPIEFGGGSNLKTAEALVSGKWVVATSTAMRGFEQFLQAPGVLIANTPREFRAAMIDVFQRAPLELSEKDRREREVLYWDRGFAESGTEATLKGFLEDLQRRALSDSAVVAAP